MTEWPCNQGDALEDQGDALDRDALDRDALDLILDFV
jgi:hypothetical protein